MNELLDLKPKRHSRYGASSAHRWGHCAGSIVMGMETSMKESPQRYTAEGTLAHAVSEACQKNLLDATDFVTGAHVNVDGFAFLIDQSFAEPVQRYIDAVVERAAAQPGATVILETETNYATLLGLKPDEAFGTVDNAVLFTDEICIIDLKFGQGEIVDPEENDQGICYAGGIYLDYADLFGYDETTKVTIVIHQPRVRKAPVEWVTTVGYILQRMGELAIAAAGTKQALWDWTALKNDKFPADGLKAWYDKYLNPSVKTCRWCPAKGTCPKARAMVTQSVTGHTPASPDEFEDLTAVKNIKEHVVVTDNDWLAASMRAVPFIKDWIKAVETEIDRRVLNGQTVEGFKVVLGQQSDRYWDDAAAVEKYMKESVRLRSDQMYTQKLIGPAGAERLATAKEAALGKRQWTKLQEHIKRDDGKPQVVPASDSRQPISVSKVEDEFTDISGAELDDLIGDPLAPCERHPLESTGGSAPETEDDFSDLL